MRSAFPTIKTWPVIDSNCGPVKAGDGEYGIIAAGADFDLSGDANFACMDAANGVARDHSVLTTRDGGKVEAFDHASVSGADLILARDDSYANPGQTGHVEAHDRAIVHVLSTKSGGGEQSVDAYDNVIVYAQNGATVDVYSPGVTVYAIRGTKINEHVPGAKITRVTKAELFSLVL